MRPRRRTRPGDLTTTADQLERASAAYCLDEIVEQRLQLFGTGPNRGCTTRKRFSRLGSTLERPPGLGRREDLGLEGENIEAHLLMQEPDQTRLAPEVRTT